MHRRPYLPLRGGDDAGVTSESDSDALATALAAVERALATGRRGPVQPGLEHAAELDALLESHTGHPFVVKEVDCWCTGDRTCRFTAEMTPA